MNVAHLNKEMFCPNNFFHPKKTFSKEKKIKTNEKKDFCARLKEPTLCLKKNSYTNPKKRAQPFFMFKEKNSHACHQKINFTKENSSLLLPEKNDFSNKEFQV